jgi:hypothetical protein
LLYPAVSTFLDSRLVVHYQHIPVRMAIDMQGSWHDGLMVFINVLKAIAKGISAVAWPEPWGKYHPYKHASY